VSTQRHSVWHKLRRCVDTISKYKPGLSGWKIDEI
jgi:hypothetical protein